MTNTIFIHGLESSGKGFKAQFFKELISNCLTPTFKEYNKGISIEQLLKERMLQLENILKNERSWIVIGSSFGGLMGTLYACRNPNKVRGLVLLAPALTSILPNKYEPINVPTIIYHGKNDKVVPLEPTLEVAKQLFTNLTHNVVNDNHFLKSTILLIDWKKILNDL